jgi:hypothetical protein
MRQDANHFSSLASLTIFKKKLALWRIRPLSGALDTWSWIVSSLAFLDV